MAGGKPRKKKLALDLSFLMAFAEGDETSQEALRLLRERNYSPVLTSTVCVEADILCLSSKPVERKIGERLLKALADHYIRADIVEEEDCVRNGYSEQAALRIRGLPGLNSIKHNSALVVAEAGNAGCDLLLSWSPEILKMPKEEINLLLLDCQFVAVQIFSPSDIISKFSPS